MRLLHNFYISILFNCHCPKDGQVIDVEVKVKLWWLHHFGFTLFQLPRMRSKIVNYFLQLETSHSWKWKWPRISDIKNNFTCLIIWVSLTIFSSFTIITFCMHLLILVQHMAPPQILPIVIWYLQASLRDGLPDQMFPKFWHWQREGGSAPCQNFLLLRIWQCIPSNACSLPSQCDGITPGSTS